MIDRERLVRTVTELIRIDSPTGEEDAIDAHLTARLSDLGASVQHDAYGNLVATLPGSNGSAGQAAGDAVRPHGHRGTGPGHPTHP